MPKQTGPRLSEIASFLHTSQGMRISFADATSLERGITQLRIHSGQGERPRPPGAEERRATVTALHGKK